MSKLFVTKSELEGKIRSKKDIHYNNTLCHIPPKKRTFYHFQVREHDNGQQFENLIFIEITLFFIEFFKWKNKKFQSKNLIHPSIDDNHLEKS